MGFYDANMLKLNDLAIYAISCPAQVPAHLMDYVRFPSRAAEQSDLELNWIWAMDKIRVMDHVTTELYKLDVEELQRKTLEETDGAFQNPDLDWLESLTDHLLTVRILAQVRPVIFDVQFQTQGDAFIRQALNAYTNAKLCGEGTLEELADIRSTVSPKPFWRGNKRHGWNRRSRFQGVNVQAWPMPNMRALRWGGQINGRPIGNRPVVHGPVNPYETLKRATMATPSIAPPATELSDDEIEHDQGTAYKSIIIV